MHSPCIVSFILFCLFIYFGFKRSNAISSFIIIAYYLGWKWNTLGSLEHIFALHIFKNSSIVCWQQQRRRRRWHSFNSTSFIEFDTSLFVHKNRNQFDSMCQAAAAIFLLFRYFTPGKGNELTFLSLLLLLQYNTSLRYIVYGVIFSIPLYQSNYIFREYGI